MNYHYIRQAQYKKGFIAPLILIIVAVLVLGGGAYVYTQQKPINPPVTENVALPQATSTAQTSEPPSQPTPQDAMTGLIDRISSVYSRDNSYTVVYHDNKTIAFVVAVPAGKSPILTIVDAHTLKQINTRFVYMWDAIQSTNYIIGVGADYVMGIGVTGDGGIGLKYYKKGAFDVEMIPDSVLPASETYVKEDGGMGSSNYDLIFDEATKILTASVFKPNSGNPNKKIRTVKFVLP
jgi:hypothetical protein